MKHEITPETLKDLLAKKGMKQKELEAILDISKSLVSKIFSRDRKISSSEQKLLALYFYGEMPFDMIRPAEELSSTLKFTGQEWKIITTLATREGYTSPQAWITAQIRGYLRNITQPPSAIPIAAEPETPYHTNIIDPATEQNETGGEHSTNQA